MSTTNTTMEEREGPRIDMQLDARVLTALFDAHVDPLLAQAMFILGQGTRPEHCLHIIRLLRSLELAQKSTLPILRETVTVPSTTARAHKIIAACLLHFPAEGQIYFLKELATLKAQFDNYIGALQVTAGIAVLKSAPDPFDEYVEPTARLLFAGHDTTFEKVANYWHVQEAKAKDILSRLSQSVLQSATSRSMISRVMQATLRINAPQSTATNENKLNGSGALTFFAAFASELAHKRLNSLTTDDHAHLIANI